MAEKPAELSPAMQNLSQAIRNHGAPVRAVFCGFDLWLEVCGSGHTSMCNFLPGGKIAKGDEPENALKVPVMVIGSRIVIGFDPTLPPDQFQLKS